MKTKDPERFLAQSKAVKGVPDSSPTRGSFVLFDAKIENGNDKYKLTHFNP